MRRRLLKVMLKKQTAHILIPILLLIVFAACRWTTTTENRQLIEEMERSLRSELLDAWYPASIDSEYGGFLCDFNFDWQAGGPQNKMLGTPARPGGTAPGAGEV